MKIIDADKLHYKQVYIQTEKGLRPALVVFAKEIRKMPEIVRCKDCVYATRNDWGRIVCAVNNEPTLFSKTEDYFCAWGRREDGKVD